MRTTEDGFLYLDRADIFEYIKNRPPLLMIDEAYVKPGELVCSEKLLSPDEWYFACHFPGNPMMPGVLQLESMFNAAALPIKVLEGNKEKTTNVSKISNVEYKRHIRPCDKIKIEVEVKKFRRGLGFMHGRILIGNDLCCQADFVLVVLDDLIGVNGE